jgi:septum formation protein
VLGKPKDESDAIAMLQKLEGRWHEVFGGVALVHRNGENEGQGYEESFVIRTEVEFCPLTLDDIHHYIETGESFDKAGAYAVQGAAQAFVTRVRGSYTNIVGFDLPAVTKTLFECGVIGWNR